MFCKMLRYYDCFLRMYAYLTEYASDWQLIIGDRRHRTFFTCYMISNIAISDFIARPPFLSRILPHIPTSSMTPRL